MSEYNLHPGLDEDLSFSPAVLAQLKLDLGLSEIPAPGKQKVRITNTTVPSVHPDDIGRILFLNATSGSTVTIDQNVFVDNADRIDFINTSYAPVVFVPGGVTTLIAPNGTMLETMGHAATAIYVGQTRVVLLGNLDEAPIS